MIMNPSNENSNHHAVSPLQGHCTSFPRLYDHHLGNMALTVTVKLSHCFMAWHSFTDDHFKVPPQFDLFKVIL